jgi:hypothetical protein
MLYIVSEMLICLFFRIKKYLPMKIESFIPGETDFLCSKVAARHGFESFFVKVFFLLLSTEFIYWNDPVSCEVHMECLFLCP